MKFGSAHIGLTVLLVLWATTAFAPDPQVVTIDFESGSADSFAPHDPKSWEVIDEGGNRVYCLKSPGGQAGKIRKPGAYSILREPSFSSLP